MDKENKRKQEEKEGQPQPLEQQQRSSAFNEQSTRDLKSTTNIEETAGGEQERKEAMTERD